MTKHLFGLAVLAFALPVAGCSSPSVPVDEASDKPLAARLGDSIDLSLADLLTKPRAHLAEMAEELVTRIQIQDKGRREGRLPFTLIPSLRLPLVVPVLRQARYSAKDGFSVPPYLAEGSKDSDLALHLARYGDNEAAGRLVDPGDTEIRQHIQAARYEREYPVEWTRLVGLLLHSAQMRLAAGDVEGGTEVVVLHRQLRAVLDPQAAKGILGAELLARGRLTLARAAAAWRANKKEELASQADAALADWGAVPTFSMPLQAGAPRAHLTRVLRSVGEGRALPALCIARAFDLLGLPFPDEGADAVVACFDDAGCLADTVIAYRSGFSEYFPEPVQLALLLEEHSVPGEDGPSAVGIRNRSYRVGELTCAVSVVVHGAGAGAFVRFSSDKATKTTVSLPRDFDAASLDRTFEQNRVRLAPEQQPSVAALTVRTKASLAQLRNPVPALHLAQAELRRETGHNLAASLELRYAADHDGLLALHKLALPFWAAFGLGQFQGVSDTNGGHLALIWEDARTRYTLRSPYDTIQPVELEVSDRQGPGQLAERERAALALDRQDREQRLKTGKPFIRLARHLEQIELGQSRSQVLKLLPSGQAVLKRDMPDGLVITYRGEPARTDSHVLRQMFIRFNNTGHVVELRTRYTDGPDAGEGRWMMELFRKIAKRAGAPLEGPSPWARVWTDLPVQKPTPVLYRWQDDITVLVYQRDATTVELALHDSSADPEAGSPLLPLEYLPRGPANVQLAESRDALLQRWKIKEPVTTEDGALVIRPAAGSAFDVILVWFDNGHAVRIVARHLPMGNSSANPARWAQALADAWGRELATLGWYGRQDFVANEILQGLGWHDDRTRVRMFWQEPETTGPARVFTEWKELAPLIR